MAYRVLNGSLSPRIACQHLRSDETPELIYVKLDKSEHVQNDMHFTYDANSLALLQVDSLQDYMELKNNSPSPHIQARYKPVFKGFGLSQPQSLCLETTHACNFSCFAPETEVSLLNGAERSLEDLYKLGEAIWVHGYYKGKVIPVKAKCYLIEKESKLLRVILDSDESVRCTSDHLFLTSDGSYISAGKLKPGDLLPSFDSAEREVVFVRECDEHSDVYCLKVDHPCHNFALSIGVFVHNCSYCFVNLLYHDLNKDTMKFPIAKIAIDRLLNPKVPLSVGFFGGEPLLNLKLIKEVVAYVQDLHKQRNLPNAHFHVTTNGSLFTEELVKYLNDNNFSLIVSLDGNKEAHDATRKYRNGKGTYDKVIEGLKIVAKFPIAKRSTLRGTFAANSKVSIADRLEHLNQLCDDNMSNWVSVEPCALLQKDSREDISDLAITLENVYSLFYDQYMETANWWVDRAKRGLTPRFHNIHKCIERIFWGLHSASECGAASGYISVNAHGEIFACHRENNSYIGDIRIGIDEYLRSAWADNRLYARSGCYLCPLRYVCGSGCRQDSMSENGTTTTPSPVFCALKDLWVKASMKVLADLPKELIAKYVRNPSRADLRTYSYLPEESLIKDESGIVLPVLEGNIPVTALVRGSEKYLLTD